MKVLESEKTTWEKFYYVGCMGDAIRWTLFSDRLPAKEDTDATEIIVCVDRLGRPSYRYWNGSRRGQVWWAPNAKVEDVFENLPCIPAVLWDDDSPVRFSGIDFIET